MEKKEEKEKVKHMPLLHLNYFKRTDELVHMKSGSM